MAPKSTQEVFITCGCGASANELAYKTAFSYYTKNNPGSKNLEIISFQSAFHGRLLSTLTTTRSKAIHKVAVPSYKWRSAVFPSIKYPYHLNETYNQLEEKKSLDYLEKLLQTGNVAGVIIEPISAEGGDLQASPGFYLGVQEIAQNHGALFIVDEVQTGGGSTGRFWAHEHWGPRADPDIVTFSKKLQVSGFYYKSHVKVDEPELLYNTYNSDHLRILNFKAIWDVIQSDKLLAAAQTTGMALKVGLSDLSKKFVISNIRGQGTLIAYDLPTAELANQLVYNLLQLGVNAGTCGERSVRVRPSLVFSEKHAQVYLSLLEQALYNLR
jgi:4-aminobutyrate aminotransferase / (S)-3-amino-2-methylpropionate transaminase